MKLVRLNESKDYAVPDNLDTIVNDLLRESKQGDHCDIISDPVYMYTDTSWDGFSAYHFLVLQNNSINPREKRFFLSNVALWYNTTHRKTVLDDFVETYLTVEDGLIRSKLDSSSVESTLIHSKDILRDLNKRLSRFKNGDRSIDVKIKSMVSSIINNARKEKDDYIRSSVSGIDTKFHKTGKYSYENDLFDIYARIIKGYGVTPVVTIESKMKNTPKPIADINPDGIVADGYDWEVDDFDEVTEYLDNLMKIIDKFIKKYEFDKDPDGSKFKEFVYDITNSRGTGTYCLYNDVTFSR